MRRSLLVLVIALIAAATPAADSGLAALDKAWTKAVLANDAAAVAELYARDAVFYPPDSMEARGREAIRKGYQAFFAEMKVTDVKFLSAKYETHGDTSIGWGHFLLRMTPKSGADPLVMEGRFSEVARNIDGKWLYVHDHASVPLPPVPTN